jgi:hypothetical protein
MRKLKYILLLAIPVAVVFFTGCLKSGDSITGPTGKTGITGATGGDLFAPYTKTTLDASSFTAGVAAGTYNHIWVFSSWKPSYTYMLTAYASKGDTGTASWYKLPYLNVFGGDELSASISRDTVTITYTNPNATWPVGSSVFCTIFLVQKPLSN